MKKTMKKVLSLALALVLAVGAMVIAPVNAKADEYTAEFGAQFDTTVNETVGEWPSFADAKVIFTEGETATFSYTFDSNVKFAGNYAAINTNYPYVEGIDAAFVSVKLDGVEMEVGAAFLNNEGTDGGLRLTLTNLWNGDITTQPADISSFPEFKTIEISFVVNGVADNGDETVETESESETESVPTAEFDPAGTYNAYIGLQTPAYSFRNAWDEATYGKATEYFNQMTAWEDNVAVSRAGTFTDVEIKGNGTYTVKVEGLGDWIANDFTTQDYFNLLFVSTDIPVDADVTFSNIKLLIDGSVKHTYETAVMDEDPGVLYKKVLVQNIWNDAVKEISYYPIPTDSVAIEFTVSGFNYDKAADETSTEGTSADTNTNTGSDANNDGGNNILPIVIVVVVVVVAVVAVVVVKKNKKAE